MNYLYEHNNGVSFRKADINDAGKLLELKNESWFGTHFVTLANLSSQEEWLANIGRETHCPRNLVLMAAYEISNYRDFGIFKILNIDWQSRRAEVGWDVFKEYRKKGLGKKLVCAGVDFGFMVLNLRRYDAQILATNEASIKCAENAGFKLEGTQKKAIYKNGKYIDNLIYGMLNEN